MKRIKINWSHTGVGDPLSFTIERLTTPMPSETVKYFVKAEPGIATTYSFIDEFDPSPYTNVQYRITAESATSLSAPVDTAIITFVLTAPTSVTTEVLPDS